MINSNFSNSIIKAGFITLLLSCWLNVNAQIDTLVYRSEYEKVGDEIVDLNSKNEGSIAYYIVAGNSAGYYSINISTGKISVAKTIADSFNQIRTDNLTVLAGSQTINVEIVDGYDYFIKNLEPTWKVLSEDDQLFTAQTSEWSVYNNLWGKGTAIPNKDFRISTIHKANLPDTVYFVWDVPSESSFASVWCYANVFWGNRKNLREDLIGFPFKIESKSSITLDFDFKQLFGDDNFKIAMNTFMTDEPYLTSFSSNTGDLFLVFDQKGTYIPPYPYSLPDSYILGKLFSYRYDDKADDGSSYQRRRVIIKNNEKLLSGKLDIKSIFNKFSTAGYLNVSQSIYHIQLGVEVTSGFGAVGFNKFIFKTTPSTTGITIPASKLNCYPNPVTDLLTVEGSVDDIAIYNNVGRRVNVKSTIISDDKLILDLSGLKAGIYFIKTSESYKKIFKQ